MKNITKYYITGRASEHVVAMETLSHMTAKSKWRHGCRGNAKSHDRDKVYTMPRNLVTK